MTTNLIQTDTMKLSKNGEDYQVDESIPVDNKKDRINTVDAQSDETTSDQVHQEDSLLEDQQILVQEKSKIQKPCISDHESDRNITEDPVERKGVSPKIDSDEQKICDEDEEKTNSIKDVVCKGDRNKILEEPSEKTKVHHLDAEFYQEITTSNEESREEDEKAIHPIETISQDEGENNTPEKDKRKRGEDSLGSLLYSCKKIKQEEIELNEESTKNLQKNEKPTHYENNTEIMDETRNSSSSTFRNNEHYDFSDEKQLRNDTESKTNEAESLFNKETLDGIKSENFAFDQDEMQSQRCVMAFNTYKRDPPDYSDSHSEKIHNVNIEQINAERKNGFEEHNNAEKHKHLDPGHILENVPGDGVNFEKGDIKIEDDSEEELSRMVGDQGEANQGRDVVGQDGIENSGDKIPAPLASQDRTFSSEDIENASIDSEDLLSLYFDNEVIYACEDCDFETETKLTLICHYKDNHHEDQRLDTTLKDDFKVPANLTKWFQCRVCFFKAKYKKNLKLHYKFKHNYEGVLYECSHPVCSYVAELKEDLLQHFRCYHVRRAVFIKRIK